MADGSLFGDMSRLNIYDFSVSDMAPEGRALWAASVADTVSTMGVGHVEAHMGRQYMRHLRPALERLAITVSTPLDGLEVGMRLQWYKHQRDA